MAEGKGLTFDVIFLPLFKKALIFFKWINQKRKNNIAKNKFMIFLMDKFEKIKKLIPLVREAATKKFFS